MRISLSLWSLDQARVADEVERYDGVVDSFHVDVMDGLFADNLLFGPLAVQTLRALTTSRIVVHLMVTEPSRWVARFADAGADVLVVHPTACADFEGTLGAIRRTGAAAGAGIALFEALPLVEHALEDLSTVLVMGTAIGVKGQPFDDSVLRTVERLRTLAAPGEPPEVFVDGGIRWTSLSRIAAAGAHGVVAGSILTSADDPVAAAAAIHAGADR